MRIVVLSRLAALYSTSRLVRAGRAQGHEGDVVDPLDLQLALGAKPRGVCYRGKALRRYDVVIPRIATSITRYGSAVVRAFEERGAVVLNGADSILLARDRLRSLSCLDAAGLTIPRTVGVFSPVGLDDAAKRIGGFPAVVKLHQGTQGVGTMLVESAAALHALAETMWSMGHEILLQEFVRSARGRDLRALVVGNRVVAAMQRKAEPGDFRANIHRGATAKTIDLDPDYVRCAKRAAKRSGLAVAGVDMLRGRKGPIVLEVNCSPGLEGIETATGIDVAKEIIALCARRHRRRKAGR